MMAQRVLALVNRDVVRRARDAAGFSLSDAAVSVSAVLIALVAGACAHRPPTLHRTPLVVMRSEGAVQPFIHATVAGHPLRLVLDTGAAKSILPIGFVRKFEVPWESTTANPIMVDANGRRVGLGRAHGIPVQFDGETSTEIIDFLVNPADGSEQMGILAPQDLIRSGWVLVIDFPRAELRYEPEKDAMDRLSRADAPLIEIDYHSCELDNHRVTPVTVNGVRSSMLIDTGASRTTLSRNNEAIPTMRSAKGKRGMATGLASQGHELEVPGVSIEFANTSFVVSAMVLPVSNTCGRGALGADVLSECAMIWGSSIMWASCRTPATAPSSN
jgi:hypothetical protein